jgi:leucyl-tRNA synthetase
MKGFNVLHPMGWDAFGEPAEQYAVAHGVHPRITTDQNTANFRRQMSLIGTSYDWSREIDSSDPAFYRWTQWFFLMLYQRGLAYRDTNWQWWCPGCQTTLSSHEVSGGVCWRGHHGVTRREIPAWYFRITAYADELVAGLDSIDWPEKVKTMQRNWIGRSEGYQVVFQTELGDSLPVFTTRPDTLLGVTFFALAPEHPLAFKLTTLEQLERVSAYIAEALSLSEVDRSMENRPKTGVFTGGYIVNPLNTERIPVWIADYVLPTYGTGAIMGVPAHDQRDFEFAVGHHLPVRVVVTPPGYDGSPLDSAYTGKGIMVNSGAYDGLESDQAITRIIEDLEARGLGREAVQYRMRDWLISRQRYWGTPIPIVYCEKCGEVPIPEQDLPVLLPPLEDFQPDGSGRSPLARVPEFVNTACPRCAGPARRETDTMGGFACSSWYFLRFTSPYYHRAPFEQQAMRYWMPVDLYVGGSEHAVLHLLYARFWVKAMADEGLLTFHEPFLRLLNQGQLLGPDGQRMSKSRGNVIIPDDIVQAHGADSLRLYELFMAPFDQDVTWSVEGIHGARRFLNRVWNLFGGTYFESASSDDFDASLERLLHQTIHRVTERIEGFRFNTMVSILMEFVNDMVDRQQSGNWRTRTYHQALETLLLLLAPGSPYIAEELWQLTGHIGSVHQQSWPAWDAVLSRQETCQIAVQVDGKLVETIAVMTDASQSEVADLALDLPRTKSRLESRELVKVIYVPGRILNIVTRRRAG